MIAGFEAQLHKLLAYLQNTRHRYAFRLKQASERDGALCRIKRSNYASMIREIDRHILTVEEAIKRRA